MRASPVVALVVALLALARPAVASDTILYAAQVKDAEAEVRSGPGTSDQVYPTNKLTRGTIVQVVEELPDHWLKICPPHGSFSFVNTRFVDRLAKSNYVVASPADVRVPVFVGSDLKPSERGNVQGTSLPRGTQVIAVGGSTLIQDDESWLRIESPVGEYRYIREATVLKLSGLTATQVATAGNGPGGQQPGAISSPAPGQDSASATAAIVAAIKADKEGRTPDAVLLYHRYLDAAQRVVPLDQQRINEVQRRVAYLEQKTAPQPGTRPAISPDSYPSSGPGKLVLAGRKVDDMVAYRLESALGYPTLYVTPRPGVNLEQYVGLKVELSGPAVYRGDLRGNYMTAVQVRKVP
jgi:SH3-like domain-containing protein